MRAFIAVIPPEEVIEQLTTFLEPRRDALAGQGAWRWTRPEHLHLTLAFLPELEEWREEQLVDDGAAWAARTSPVGLRLRGAGAFPDPGAARVLWAAVTEQPSASSRTGDVSGSALDPHLPASDVGGSALAPHLPAGDWGGPALDRQLSTGDVGGSLAAWAKALRALASHAGARVDGTRFSPHVTLARAVGGRHHAGHLLQALDTLSTSAWTVDEVHLVSSHLGQGPRGTPRYEVRHTWELARSRPNHESHPEPESHR